MRALVLGGAGALGRSVIKVFSQGWQVTSADFVANQAAFSNIIIDSSNQLKSIQSGLKDQYNCIFCVAGGWAGGSIKDTNLMSVYDEMHSKNVIPALISCHLATKYLSKRGTLVLVGSHGVYKETTPNMIAYALAKTAVHQLTLQVAAEKSLLPEDAAIITILPEVIDTPGNREAMPKSDFSKWNNPDQIAQLVKAWAEGLNRPASGSLVHLQTQNSSISPKFL